ncbi:MAG: hypothetical protein ACKOEX_10245 [Planctomycetia bacterium]
MACCALLLLFAGCRNPGPDVQMVEGVVTLDDKPLAGAALTFIPSTAGGISAAGLTRDDGRYVLSATVGKRFGEGTVQGEYVVTIHKLVDPPAGGEPVLATPRVYADRATTPLRAVVNKGSNKLDFSLKTPSK